MRVQFQSKYAFGSRTFFFSLALTLASIRLISAQTQTINFELNARKPSDTSKNPFGKFIGEWTLKDDNWTHNWGNGTETIKISKHHTISRQINTDNTLLSIIDGPEPNGHIFWSYNPNTEQVSHLSSFGTMRVGTGTGSINKNGDVKLKLNFEGEPKGTYRIYNYRWISEDEYYMKSVQYSNDDEPTGLFYEGQFVRVNSNEEIKKKIESVLRILDNNQISKEEQLSVYSDNIIHMAPNNEVITNKKDLLQYLIQQAEYGHSDMKHKILEYSDHGNIIIMRGSVEGTFHPSNGADVVPFRTKNLFVFEKFNNVLKIMKVIYNISPI